MELDGDADDLLQLVSLGHGRVNPIAPLEPSTEQQHDAFQVALFGRYPADVVTDDSSIAAEKSELQQLVYMGNRRPTLRTRGQAVLNAQLGRYKNHRRSLKSDVEFRKRGATVAFAQIASAFPFVAKAFGFKASLGAIPDLMLVRADIRMRLAVASSAAAAGLGRAVQQRATTILHRAGELVQEVASRLCLALADENSHLDRLDDSAVGGGDSSSSTSGRLTMVRAFMRCWDESEQKVKRFRSRASRCAVSAGAQSQTIIVQTGGVCKCTTILESGDVYEDVEPNVIRPRRLESTSSSYIYEGINRGVPGKDLAQWFKELAVPPIGGDLLAVWVLLGADRAGQNYVVADAIFNVVEEVNPVGICHIDFCGLHGVALARNRPLPSKQLTTGMSSWTKWVKLAKNTSDAQKALDTLVYNERPVTWYQFQRPHPEVEGAEAFKQSLFPDDAVLWQLRKLEDGSTTLVPSPLCKRLDGILSCRHWVVGSPGGLAHWCEWVQHKDVNGCVVWDWCCNSLTEARGQIRQKVDEWLFGTVWSVAADNRWTTQPAAQCRILVAECVDELVTRSLKKVLLALSLEDQSLVAALKRVVENDPGNWSARNKMRFRNIYQHLCASSEFGLAFAPRLGIVVTGGRRLDEVMYAFLGRKGVSDRATLVTC